MGTAEKEKKNIAKGFQPLGEYLEEKKRSGEVGEVDPNLAARAFLGMFFSFLVAHEFILGKKVAQVSNEAVIREFVGIFLRGTQRNA